VPAVLGGCMIIFHCSYCNFKTFNPFAYENHQYSCKAIKRLMVQEAIVKKGQIFPSGSRKDDKPLSVESHKGVIFQEDREMSKLRMWFDFGPWLNGGRSTSVIERKIL
jgi:hypothetical protein